MNIFKRHTFIFFLITTTLLLILSFQSNAFAKEKVVVYARPFVAQMDPAAFTTSEGLQNAYMVYDTLVTVDRSGKVSPSIAESWEVSSDYKDYTFHLKKGVNFHDGTLLNAQAVKFSFNRMLRVKRMTFGGQWPKVANKDSCEVVDGYTIKIHLVKPFALFLKDLMYYCILSPSYVKKHATADDPDAEKWMTDHACGSGPFKLVEFLPGQRLVFEKFKGYWGGAKGFKETPKIDRVIHRIVADSSTARMMLEKGSVDIVEKLTTEEFEKLETTAGVQVLNFLIPRACYITMDVSKPPFNDINVRKAISYAINYQEIIKYIERNKVKRLYGLIPEGIMAHNPELPIPKYDLGKAKELIKASGYPNGFTTTLIFAMERRAEFQQVAVYIQAYLKKIGINMKVQKIAFDTQIAKMEKGDYGMSLMWWTAINPDPDDIAGWLYDSARASGGWNASYWHDKDVQAKLAKAREIVDQDQRIELYQSVDRKAVDQAIYIYLYQLYNQFAMRENIKDFHYDAMYKIYFWSMNKE